MKEEVCRAAADRDEAVAGSTAMSGGVSPSISATSRPSAVSKPGAERIVLVASAARDRPIFVASRRWNRSAALATLALRPKGGSLRRWARRLISVAVISRLSWRCHCVWRSAVHKPTTQKVPLCSPPQKMGRNCSTTPHPLKGVGGGGASHSCSTCTTSAPPRRFERGARHALANTPTWTQGRGLRDSSLISTFTSAPDLSQKSINRLTRFLS